MSTVSEGTFISGKESSVSDYKKQNYWCHGSLVTGEEVCAGTVLFWCCLSELWKRVPLIASPVHAEGKQQYSYKHWPMYLQQDQEVPSHHGMTLKQASGLLGLVQQSAEASERTREDTTKQHTSLDMCVW
ncbi:uncharacterized protein ACDP82_001793 [Pangshura tecta]